MNVEVSNHRYLFINYMYYVKLLKKQHDHIYNLYNLNIIQADAKDNYIHSIKIIYNKLLQYSYKINENKDKYDEYDLLKNKLIIFNNDKNKNKINKLYPLYFMYGDILNIILRTGLKKISDFLYFFNNMFNYEHLLDENTNKIIKYFNKYLIMYNIEISKDDKFKSNCFLNSEYLKIVKNKIQSEVLLNGTKIIIKFKNQIIIFYGTIRNDDYLMNYNFNIECFVSKSLKHKRNNIKKRFNTNDLYIQKYINNISLYELILIDEVELYDYLNIQHNKYIIINSKNFSQIYKEFTESKYIHVLFNYIKLLLIGSEDNINIAQQLINVIRNKNNNQFNLIYDNLSYELQLKIKKQLIKVESNKIIECDQLDYKQQLQMNYKIPNYVRTLINEKINEIKLNNNDHYKQSLYVKTLLQFPWYSNSDIDIFTCLDKKNTKDFLLKMQSKINKITYGHENAKEQLLLLLGQWITKPESKGKAIGLHGCPGVGKTLFAKSIGEAMGIPFVHITLGGQNDGELLHGHGYTYQGAQPGLIIKKMIEAGQSRCIMYFDELDKTNSKNGGVNEIMSILIHLTDPNMNNTFQDRFFQGIHFPLDRVIFIASYNDSSKIDPVLLDRFVELEIKPYSVKDKLNIIEKYIINEIINNIGLTNKITFIKEDMEKIINEYTNEAGVRGIKRLIELTLLQINKKNILECTNENINLTYELMTNFLQDMYQIKFNMIHPINEIGLINGLYATNDGSGGITKIQIKKKLIQDNGQFFTISGTLGETMKESINVAYTNAIYYIESHKEEYDIKNVNEYINEHFKNGFHVHVSELGIQKDGPSAACAFSVCFISTILNKKIERTIALTGELDLFNNVTIIGGLQFKFNGAKKAGIKIVLVSYENEQDIIKIIKRDEELFNENFKYVLIKNLDDAVKYCFIKENI